MPTDPYAVLRALLRAEARRSAPPQPERKNHPQPQQSAKEDNGR